MMTADMVDWSVVGFSVMGISFLIFGLAAFKRQWTVWALLAGLANLPFPMINAAAPFRGALDPDYAGYVMGMVHASPGIEVAVFAGFMLVMGLTSATLAVLNKPGERNYLIVGFNAIVLLVTVPPLLTAFGNNFAGYRIEFGEYLQFHGISAFAFEFALITLPIIYSAMWAWRKARTD
jgi:hypothetical protein